MATNVVVVERRDQNGEMANGTVPNSSGANHRSYNSTVDEHFDFFKSICDRANEYYIVQKAKGTYAATKQNFGVVGRTLDRVEGRVYEAAQMSAPIYEHYLFPATDRMLGYYNRSVETSKTAVDRTKTAAVTSGTLGLGLALVATQLGLIAGTAATNLFVDGLIATKNAGGAVVTKGVNMEKAIEAQVYSALHMAQELAKHPVEKATDGANLFLDVANNVFERLLSLPPSLDENPEASLRERVTHLAQRVASGLSTSANQNIVEPCQRQLNAIVEQLSKSLILVDYLKKKREWTFEKVDQISSSVLELRNKIENEAVQACTTPEVALVRSIRHSSGKLNEQLLKLRTNAPELLNGAMRNYLEGAVTYIEQLDLTFANAEDIYQVKDEVVAEAKQKLHEIAEWTGALINVRASSDSPSANGTKPQGNNSTH
jgi:hypothetical protein